ncbi:MAG: transporter [Flavobacteriaceae bacterium]
MKADILKENVFLYPQLEEKYSSMTLFRVLFSAFCFTSLSTYAQYTETINSNRPGASSGAYAVGINVIQAEGGFIYTKNNHELQDAEFGGAGLEYEFRYGIWKEALEVNLSGSFQAGKVTDNFLGTSESVGNFRMNTIGAKYLFFDPYKKKEGEGEEKPNLYSWHANHKFQWKTLIPSVAVYAGMNFNITNTPFVYGSNFNFNNLEEPTLSPKIMLITQNNWSGGWVFTMNFIGDRVFMTDYPIYSYILTLTHALSEKAAVFGEHQGIINDIYSDSLFRFGGAYLLSKDIQLDAGLTLNTKNTPSVFGLNVGFSYRMDFHKDPENNNSAEDEKERKDNAGGKNRKKKKKDGSGNKEKKSNKDVIDFND